MSNNEPDYTDNLFFNPQTEWKGTALDALGKKHARFSYRLLQNKIEENEKLKDENEQLKELLKECKDEIGDDIDDCTDYRIELICKIGEVLK